MGFTWIAWEGDERSKFESQSRISIVRAISSSGPLDRALHAL
jgi:hypothetical protein